MKYRLLLFKFNYLEDRYFFPVIINEENLLKAKVDTNFIELIEKKLSELPFMDDIKLIHQRVDEFVNLQSEFNSIMGEFDIKNYRAIRVELQKEIPLNIDELGTNLISKFKCKDMYLPIRRLDYFNDIEINPFIIINISELDKQ